MRGSHTDSFINHGAVATPLAPPSRLVWLLPLFLPSTLRFLRSLRGELGPAPWPLCFLCLSSCGRVDSPRAYCAAPCLVAVCRQSWER
eukprot:5962005-Alexandrium_andersonii.AAC.1